MHTLKHTYTYIVKSNICIYVIYSILNLNIYDLASCESNIVTTITGYVKIA